MISQMSENSSEKKDFSNLSNKEIDEFIEQLKVEKYSFEQRRDECKRIITRIERRTNQNFDSEIEIRNTPKIIKIKHEMKVAIRKRDLLYIEIKQLKELLFQFDESISMTKEDLTSKLLQRANFVAQREEFEEIIETNKYSNGEEFELFWKLQENSTPQLLKRYQNLKIQNFYKDILQQLLDCAKTQELFSESESEIDSDSINHSLNSWVKEIKILYEKVDSDVYQTNFIEDQILNISEEFNLSSKYSFLLQNKEEISEKTDRAYSERYSFEILEEIKRCEKNIKNNYFSVDKSIIPQLKSLSLDYKTRQKKYKKIK